MASSLPSTVDSTNIASVIASARDLLARLAGEDPSGRSRPSLEELGRSLKAVVNRTEVIEAHRATLLQQQAALRTVISSVPHFVFWKDTDCVYRGCNDIFASLGGLKSPDDIVGKTDYDMPWTKEQSDLYRVDDLHVIRGGEPMLNIEETNLDADGNEKVILTSKVPLKAEDGRIIGMLGIFADISARKQLEKELSRSKELAEAANSAKGDFLAAMSHELRTPLTLILSPVESLLGDRRNELSAPVTEVLERVYRNAHRLKVLTDDILDLSKHQAGHLKLKVEPVQISEHLKQLVLDMAPAATARKLALNADAVADGLGAVMLDVAKFDKIIINLVGNALKFTPEGGAISVSARLDGGNLVFAVKDTGIGIAPEDHERLFKRFEQVDGGSKRRHGGTGLGLSLVKQFAELMGGTARVDSTLGQGATFSVMIPRHLADNQAATYAREYVRQPAALASATPASGEGSLQTGVALEAPHVLIAEDSDELRAYIAGVLGSHFHVSAVADGQAALDAIRKERPDVVVSDVMMPVMDGFELVANMKGDAELATIPILLLTARAGVEASADSLDRGADDYLTKPFNPLDLVARVRAAYRMKLLHTQVREAEARAETAERFAGLGRLLAKLAHELNNPINVIHNGLAPIEQYSQVLVQYAKRCDEFIAKANGDVDIARLREALEYDYVVEDLPPALAAIREATRRVMGVQSDLRLFLHGRTALQRSPSDLNELVASSLELTRRATGGKLHADLVLGAVPLFAFDRGRVSQALLNLLKNAGEAAGPEGRIQVETSTAGGLARIAISDNGAGVPEALRTRIFEPFFTTKEVGLGTGLGLAISAEMVTQHGGRLYLDPTYASGARFIIELPVSVEIDVSDGATEPRKVSSSTSPAGMAQ